MKTAITRELAIASARKHLEIHRNFDHYTGVVTLHGLARLATLAGDPALIEEVRTEFLPYARGERTYHANFPNYFCGGNGAAYLLWQGRLPEVKELVRKYSEQLLNEAPRDPQGIYCLPAYPEKHRIWIDAAFAVCPFLLFSGLALGEEAFIEEAFQQAAKMVGVFQDPENQLLHQSKNFTGQLPGNLSEDHWSRGNGWGIYALTELACHLPANHPRKPEAVRLYTEHVNACLQFQDDDGLWHQEMTETKSYVETSGSGLILYAIGAGIESGILDESFKRPFVKGLGGLLAYISPETDIYHACQGCLCPGTGTKLDYMARGPVLNDPHAFGSVVLSMGQAHILGINQIDRN